MTSQTTEQELHSIFAHWKQDHYYGVVRQFALTPTRVFTEATATFTKHVLNAANHIFDFTDVCCGEYFMFSFIFSFFDFELIYFLHVCDLHFGQLEI